MINGETTGGLEPMGTPGLADLSIPAQVRRTLPVEDILEAERLRIVGESDGLAVCRPEPLAPLSEKISFGYQAARLLGEASLLHRIVQLVKPR